MAGRRILSDAQLEEMCSLRERGWGVDRIAAYFTERGTSISGNAINWQCMRLGADTLPKFRGKHSQPEEPYRRGGHIVRPYTPEDDALLTALDIQGTRICVIARRMGRAPNSIRGRLLTLARREARREDAA